MLELRDVPRPVIGYIGLVSFFLSFEWLEALGKAFPEATVVFVGPVHARVRGRVALWTLDDSAARFGTPACADPRSSRAMTRAGSSLMARA